MPQRRWSTGIVPRKTLRAACRSSAPFSDISTSPTSEAPRNFEFRGIAVTLFLEPREFAQNNPDARLADEPLPAKYDHGCAD